MTKKGPVCLGWRVGSFTLQGLQRQQCFVYGMMTVNLKISGSKGRYPGQSPGKVKSSRKLRSDIPDDAGLQLAAATTLSSWTEEEKGQDFSYPQLSIL